MLFPNLRNRENKKTARLGRRTSHGSRARPHFRPRLEPLEDRTLMSASFLKDINVNGASSNPSNLLNVNGTLLFTANDGGTGVEERCDRRGNYSDPRVCGALEP